MSNSLTMHELKLGHQIFIVNGGDLVANALYEAVKCKMYPTLPRNIDVITEKLTALYKSHFRYVTDDIYMKEFFGYTALLGWIEENVMVIPEIRELNIRQREYDLGERDADSDRPSFPRKADSFGVEEDFIDLGAFSRNLCHDLIRENIDINYSTFPDSPYYKCKDVVKDFDGDGTVYHMGIGLGGEL